MKPPVNERLLLAGLVAAPEIAVASGIQPGDWPTEQGRVLFGTILERLAAGEVVTRATVGIPPSFPEPPSAKETAALAQDLWGQAVARRLAREAEELLEKGVVGDAFLEALGAAVDRVGRGGGSTPRVREIAGHRARELQMDRSAARVATGYTELDRRLGGGMLRGVPCVVGARTGHGKSAFALGVTRNVVRRGGKAIVFSMEDAARQYVDRVLSAETGIPATELEKGGRDLSGPASRLPEGWWLDDGAGLTGRAISRRARLLAHRAGSVDLVVVDYLQLIRSEKAGQSPHQVISEAMADLAKLARDLDCPVLGLSQINRRVEHEKRPPTLADLKESGSLEEVAKMVLLVHREGFDTDRDDTMDVHIAKASFSGPGKVRLRWEGPLTRVT